MATIISINGEYLTQGLDSGNVSDQAIQTARRMAKGRNEVVYLEDNGEYWAINPDGSYGDVPDWVVETEA